MNKTKLNKPHWIHAGMYANTPAHQQAWRHWFKAFTNISGIKQPLELGFGQTDDTYLADDLLMAQTCGYPLIKKWSTSHHPIAVATFDVAGCDEGRYSSWFICHKNNPRQRLDQFANCTAAINGPDSNSGCNVLRYAVSQLANLQPNKPYFKRVIQSGGHWNSLQLVAEGKVDLAAIDSVSYALALQHNPELQKSIKPIGQSEYTMGLPFIAPKALKLNTIGLVEKMDAAVQAMDNNSRELLFVKGFIPTRIEDYESIHKLHFMASKKGYSQLL